MEKEITLTLYVGGATVRSKRAIHQLRGIMEHHFENNYNLDIIDIYDNMNAAERDNIMVVPTIIKEAPPPKLRLLGSLSNEARVLQALDLET